MLKGATMVEIQSTSVKWLYNVSKCVPVSFKHRENCVPVRFKHREIGLQQLGAVFAVIREVLTFL